MLTLAAVVACAGHDAQASTDAVRADSLARARQDSVNRAQPGYIVDSIFPIEEEIRRFNADLARPDSLTGGASNRGELVRLFAAAVARHDTAALRRMVVSRAEFGHLVFPESPNTRPPYKTKPGVIWMQLASESQRGLQRLLDRVAGSTAHISQLQCDSMPKHEGKNRYWSTCTVLLRQTSATARRMQLFGPLVERDGRVKFLSYATGF